MYSYHSEIKRTNRGKRTDNVVQNFVLFQLLSCSTIPACQCSLDLDLNVFRTKIDVYKTWSSVSNSNLSKTFALGSLESLKFRSSVLSLQRSFSLKFILGQKKFWVKKKFGSEQILVPRKILGIKTLGLKIFQVQQIFCTEKILGLESPQHGLSIKGMILREVNSSQYLLDTRNQLF